MRLRRTTHPERSSFWESTWPFANTICSEALGRQISRGLQFHEPSGCPAWSDEFITITGQLCRDAAIIDIISASQRRYAEESSQEMRFLHDGKHKVAPHEREIRMGQLSHHHKAWPQSMAQILG